MVLVFKIFVMKNIKRQILFFGFLLSFIIIHSKNDSCHFKTLNDITRILKTYIDSAKKNSIGEGEYNIYVINVFVLNEKKKELGFTLGYINNEYDLDFMEPWLFRSYSDEIAIIKYNGKINIKSFDCLGYKEIQESEIQKIRKKLFPKKDGGITGTSIGWVYYSRKNNSRITYYENSDEIPIDKSIYSKFPKVIIKQVKQN